MCISYVYGLPAASLPPAGPVHRMHGVVSDGQHKVCYNIIIKSGIQYHCSPIFQVLLKFALEMSDSAWYNAVW